MEVLNLINGSHCPAVSGKTLDLTDPSKGEVYGSIPRSAGEDVELAVAAAKAAFDNWKNTPAEKRGECLDKLADMVRENLDLLVKAESRDNGKPVGLAGHVDIPRRERTWILCFCYISTSNRSRIIWRV